MKSRNVILAVLGILILGALVMYTFFPTTFQLPKRSAQTTGTSETAENLRTADSDDIMADIDSDLSSLETDYEFNADITEGDLAIPEFGAELDSEL